MLRTSEIAAAPIALSRFIEDVRVSAPVDGCARYEWLPDGCLTLVFRVLDDGRRGDVCLAGPRTHALFKNIRGLVRATIVQFKPGWSMPLFGVAASALTDQIVPLADVWGRAGDDLYVELLATRDVPELLDRVARAVEVQTQRSFEPAAARLARRAARMLEEGEVRVNGVAAHLGVTARHLRRAFADHVGLSPKEYARTARLQRAVRMVASSNDWSSIAASAGYYDQAHFIADFRRLMGVTPGVFAKGIADASLVCD